MNVTYDSAGYRGDPPKKIPNKLVKADPILNLIEWLKSGEHDFNISSFRAGQLHVQFGIIEETNNQ
jgi:hypothetical protein